MLAVLPTYEDFEDFAKEQGINEKDKDEVRDGVKMFLEDFSEIEIKKKMLAEAENIKNGRNYCSAKEVEKFESQGRILAIGMNLDEYLDSLDYFDSEEEKEEYKKEYVLQVKYGVVDYGFS